MQAANVKQGIPKIFAFSSAPDIAVLAVIAVAALLVIVLFYVIIFLISDYTTTKKVEHKAPDSHRLLMDLQKAILNEMRGTARQNTLMICLTILFISISTIGIIISVLGPVKTMAIFMQMVLSVKSLILRISVDFSRALGM